MELISREEALKMIREWFEIVDLNPDILVDSINSLPTIEERKEGKWIILGEPTEGRPKRWRVICPICRKTLRLIDKELWGYCPRCGAKMKGE